MTFEEYLDYSFEKSKQDYWKDKAAAESFSNRKGFRPELEMKNESFDKIFGGGNIDIQPNGSAELTFGGRISRTKNPLLPIKQQRNGTFDFDEKIQLNVIGNIGDKLKLTTNYNTEATFDFQNQMKLQL